jgi:hypothetical protein
VVPVSWMKGVDIIVCTVHLWLLSALPLLLNTTHLRAMLNARRNHEHANNLPAYVIKDGLALSVLASSTAIWMFCLQCVRVIWPGIFRGERHSAISKIVANERRMLVGTRRHALLFIINLAMWLAYHVYAVRITVRLRTTSCDPHCYR